MCSYVCRSWHLWSFDGLGMPVSGESAKALRLPFGSGNVLGNVPLPLGCSLASSSVTEIG